MKHAWIVISPVCFPRKPTESAVGSPNPADVDFHVRLGPVDLHDQNSPSSDSLSANQL